MQRDTDDRPTVLVVDDEPETADLYAEILDDDYEVRTAYSGQAALDAVSDDVAVVLLDRRMPELTGDAVLEEIRARGVECRVVMVTAVDPDVELIDMAFDDYLVKPVAPEAVQDAVGRMLARNAYDATIQEAVGIASKMATLEANMDIDELEASEEYAALESRLAALREELDAEASEDFYSEFTREKVESLLT